MNCSWTVWICIYVKIAKRVHTHQSHAYCFASSALIARGLAFVAVFVVPAVVAAAVPAAAVVHKNLTALAAAPTSLVSSFPSYLLFVVIAQQAASQCFLGCPLEDLQSFGAADDNQLTLYRDLVRGRLIKPKFRVDKLRVSRYLTTVGTAITVGNKPRLKAPRRCFCSLRTQRQ